MIFLGDTHMIGDPKLRSKLIQLNLKRVVDDDNISRELINKIDMTLSIGHTDKAVDILEQYQCLLCQMDSDATALLNLLVDE